jgi:hypothetical protein
MPRRPSIAILSICIALVTVAAPALAGGASDEPIVLTNDDVKRLKKPSSEGGNGATGGRLVIVPSGDGAPAAAPANDLASAPSAPSAPAPVSAPAAASATSWQEEYYRLKTLALQQAMERGEAIHFGDVPDGAGPAAPSPGPAASGTSSSARYGATGPSCVYGTNGRLIHQPSGMGCSPVRLRGLSPNANGTGTGSARCLYGIHGEVLHAPVGRECKRTASGSKGAKRR